MEDTITKQFEDFKNSLQSKAEELVVQEFPLKIMKMNELLLSRKFLNRELESLHQELNIPVPNVVELDDLGDGPSTKKMMLDPDKTKGTKVMAIISGPVPENKSVCHLIDLVKPYIRYLIEDANLLKMWISFMIPKIEDGNNFGVEIQEDTKNEIEKAETQASAYFEQIAYYFNRRGYYITRVAKYPHVNDMRRAVQELDEKEYMSMWLVLTEIRNRYCTLHDLVIKNLEKIKKPRSYNTHALY